jgi:sterol desaturase/sphingolipid hydroxylase (fatty acid hydroxylase superfamily)
MHLPKMRFVEKTNLFRKLNGHHLLHHRYMNRNYNVVLPFADLIFGTLLRRSPIKFKQCSETYCLPNVQPK